MRLQETFRLIITYESFKGPIPLYDVRHFEERVAERVIRHLHQPRSVALDILREGCKVIDELHEFALDDYMITSPSRNIKIPVTITKSRHHPESTIGLVPTILWVNTDYDQRPYYKNVLIESLKRPIAIPLFEGSQSFVDYFDQGELIPSYETIYVK